MKNEPRHPTRHTRLAVVGLFAGLGLAALGAGIAAAYWISTDSSHSATAAADTLPRGATPSSVTATPNANSNTVSIAFSQASTTGGVAIPAANSSLVRYPASGGSGVSVTSACAGSTVITCTENNVPDGSWQYTDTPTYGTNWVGSPSSHSATVTVDTTAPTATVTSPVSATTYGANWSGSFIGTASDATSGVRAVALTITDTSDSTFWNGSSWQATSTSVAATGTTSWSYGLTASNLASTHSYSVLATATDAVGNTGSSSIVTFAYNTTAPTATVTYPVSATTYGANWGGSLTGTAGAASGLSVSTVALTIKDTTANTYWNGSSWQAGSTTVAAAGTTNWSYNLAAARLTSVHSYSVVATATDSGSNTGSSSIVTFAYNTTAPTATVTYPVSATTYGANWSGSLTGTAGAAIGLSVSTVALTIKDTTANTYWNGSSWQPTSTSVAASGTTGWSYGLTAAALTSVHSYSVVATATDSGGNAGGSSAATWTYNTTPPTAGVSFPVNNTTYGANWSGSVTGTSSAASGLSVSSVALTIKDTTSSTYWNGTSWQAGPATVTATGTTSWNAALATGNLTNGDSYTVSATATDSVSNTGSSSTVTFTYSIPTVTVTSPVSGNAYGANWSGSITGTATPTSGLSVSSVALTIKDTTANTYWNGSSWQAGSTTVTATGTTSWADALAAAKLTSSHGYSVVAKVTDSGSNTATSSTATWTYNTTAPSVSVSSPPNNTTYGANWSGSLSGTAGAGSGLSVSSVALTIKDTTANTFWNGTSWQAGSTTVTATGTTTWSYALAAADLTSTHHYSVVAKATDNAGNTASGSTVAWVYNTTAPTVTVKNPTTGTTYHQTSGHGTVWPGSISGTASATGPFTVAGVTLTIKDTTANTFWNGTSWQGGSTTVAATGTTNWSDTLAATSLTSGDSYSVVATATDTGSNTGTSSTVTFTFASP